MGIADISLIINQVEGWLAADLIALPGFTVVVPDNRAGDLYPFDGFGDILNRYIRMVF